MATRKTSKKIIEAEKSSGNVFRDIGFSKAEADELMLKAKLLHEISTIIKTRKLKQTEAASILSIDQPKISALLNGRLEGFSIERLIRFLRALDTQVDVVFKKVKAS